MQRMFRREVSVPEVPDPTVALVTEVKHHSVYPDIGQESRYAHGQSKHKGLGLLEHGGQRKNVDRVPERKAGS